jgi:PAS domain S-box-containing protein
MDEKHSLLKRQLKRHFGNQYTVPSEWQDFISSVNSAYLEFDSDRGMLERSLEISSQELIQANTETRSIIQLFPDAFLWLEQDGTILNYRSSGQNGLDWLKGILNISHIQEMEPGIIKEGLLQAISQAIETKLVSNVRFSVHNKHRDTYYEARVIPPLSNRILVIIRDITEQQMAGIRLEESEERFRRLAENAPDVIARLELVPKPHYSYISPAIRDLTGFSPEEFYADYKIGHKIVHPDDRKAYRFAFDSNILKTPSTVRWRCKNGTYIWIEQRVVPVLDKSGNMVAIESISRDVTGRKIDEKKIQDLYEQEKKQRQELEEEAQARGQFIDVLAHELRTPLTPVLVSVQMLCDLLSPSSSSIQEKLTNNVLKGITSLADRLEELLDLARFSRGTFKLNVQPLDPRVVLEDIARSYSPTIVQKHQLLTINILPDLPQITADRSRLEHVLFNLLSNASKYSPENTEITLKAGKENNNILVEIQDHGIGIAQEDQNKLFMPYHRVEQDRQSFPGIGLGLSVSRQIIEAHHGQIWIESQRGMGSTFKFTLPIGISPNPQP